MVSLIDIEVNHLRGLSGEAVWLPIKNNDTPLRIQTIIKCLDESVHIDIIALCNPVTISHIT